MLKKILSRLAGSGTFQKIVERNIIYSLKLMGIGSGAGVIATGESKAVELLSRFEEPHCIFDAGANAGRYLKMVYSRINKKEFEIHSFEPCRHSFELLIQSAPADSRIILNNLGLGKREGEETIYYNKEGSTLASLSKRRLDHFGINFDKSEKIRLTTVDNYCASKNIKRIHLLKLDIEGHELEALEGAKRMFNEGNIDMTVFEFGGCNIDSRTFFQDFFYFFKSLNMKIYRITPSGFLLPIEEYKEEYEQFITTNYLAVKNALAEKII